MRQAKFAFKGVFGRNRFSNASFWLNHHFFLLGWVAGGFQIQVVEADNIVKII
jgi:hypothetical protein